MYRAHFRVPQKVTPPINANKPVKGGKRGGLF